MVQPAAQRFREDLGPSFLRQRHRRTQRLRRTGAISPIEGRLMDQLIPTGRAFGVFIGVALSAGSQVSVVQLSDDPTTANGGTDPYPIPWLDKNGRNPRTFTISKVALPAAVPSQAWAPAIEEINRTWYSDHRLWRVLGRPRSTRHLHSYMTDIVRWTSGPRKSDTRFSPSYRLVRTLLGRSCTKTRSDYHCGGQYLHAGNAERRHGRPAATAGARFDSHSSTNDLQDGLAINGAAGNV